MRRSTKLTRWIPLTDMQGSDKMILDRRFLVCGLAYAVFGMGLGIYLVVRFPKTA